MKKISCLTLAIILLLLTFSAFSLSASADEAKLVAITFDDGPSKNTETLLDALKEYGAKATFFTVGSRISKYTSTVERIINEGHQLAGHSYSHAKLTTLSYEDAKNEMDSGIATIAPFANYSTYLIRPPYGSHNDTVESVGYPLILWSVDTLDWKSRNADSVYSNLMSMTNDGAILLLHDLYDTSVEGAIRAIPELQAQGYEFVTVSELYRRRGITIEGGGVYTHAKPNGNNLPAVSAPVISELDENGSAKAQMTVNAAGFDIYYTTDGSNPTVFSTKYTSPIEVRQPTNFKAVAIDSFGTKSPVAEKSLNVLGCDKVKFDIKDGILTLSCATESSKIYYTTDKSTPNASSTLYTIGFKPDSTVKAVAIREGYLDSPVLTLSYTKYGDIFSDTDESKWYFDIVSEAFHRGIFSGVGNYRFGPEISLSRAMFVTLLAKLSGDDMNDFTSNGSGFGDVPDNEWYAKAVSWASEKGITAGYSNGNFGPNDLISREQLCVMLAKFMSVENIVSAGKIENPSEFVDKADISNWAVEAVANCHALGLVNGVGGGRFNPLGTASRAESAAVLLALCNKKDSGELITTTAALSVSTTSPAGSETQGSGVLGTVFKFVAITLLSLLAVFIILLAFFRIRKARRRARRRAARAARIKYNNSIGTGSTGNTHMGGKDNLHRSVVTRL